MAYRVVVRPSARRAIASWGLSDGVLVDVYLRLDDQLSSEPFRVLRRATTPFDGMVYSFSMVDPENRLCEHQFEFQVQYAQDEQHLLVVRAGHRRQTGL